MNTIAGPSFDSLSWASELSFSYAGLIPSTPWTGAPPIRVLLPVVAFLCGEFLMPMNFPFQFWRQFPSCVCR